MDKKSLVILLVTSAFASTAFANNSFINKFVKKHPSASMTKSHATTKQTKHAYTDFTGTWVPNCGDGPSDPVVIENDAYSLKVNGDEVRIGQGIQIRNDSNESYIQIDNNSFEWNEDGTALTMKGVNIYKSNIDNSAMQTDMDKLTLTMQNGQIHLDGDFSMFEDAAQAQQTMTLHCVFSKKQ